MYTSTNSTTSFDTRPHESTWIYGPNYAHARTVDTRCTLRLILHQGIHVKSAPITLCVPFCKCPWALTMHVGARGGWALTRAVRPERDRVHLDGLARDQGH